MADGAERRDQGDAHLPRGELRPITSIIKVRDHKEALDIANDTDYGLSAGVITNDMQKAMELAFSLDSGMVHLNDSAVSDEARRVGGVKNSGFGREAAFLDGGDDRTEIDHDPERAARLSDVSASWAAIA